MIELNNIINKMYVEELVNWGDSTIDIDKSKVLSNVFAKMDANVRIELMQKVGVYDRGNIRGKREACISYMLSNIIDDTNIDTVVIGEFEDLANIKDIPNSNVVHSKERSKKGVDVVLSTKDKEDAVVIPQKHSRDIKDGFPIDVIKTVLRGKGLETLDSLYLDKDKNIVTCVKSGKRDSIRLVEEDFVNTRIILDLLSISYT